MVIGFNKQFPDKITAGTKKHTIREDVHNRWHAGMVMHMATGVRTKNYNCFKLDTCKSTQHICIFYDYPIGSKRTVVIIDNKYIYDNLCPDLKAIVRMNELAFNDGFDSIESFFEWFNSDFSGKLIHWTDLRY